MAVTRRRKLFPPHPRSSPSPLSDQAFHRHKPTDKRLPMRMELDFQRFRAMGRFQGDENSAKAVFLKATALWRSRIRGVDWRKGEFFAKVERDLKEEQQKQEEEEDRGSLGAPIGTEQEELDLSLEEVAKLSTTPDSMALTAEVRQTKIVAHRIYLPNIQIRLMRNFTPLGEPYDPFVATFRIPPSMTKTDLRSYLKAVYDLDTTFIRTDLYWGEVFRDPRDGRIKRRTGPNANYKRAIVGLHEPFHYPDDMRELYAMGRDMGLGDRLGELWKEQLEMSFNTSEFERLRQQDRIKVYKDSRKYRALVTNRVSLAFARVWT